MKNLDFVLLQDCYGSLLTERQRELLEGYYDDDLSLAELAAPLGISRQAVHDSIRRGERQLESLEQQMGIAARLKSAKALFEEIRTACQSLEGSTAAAQIAEAAEQGIAVVTS